MLLHSAIRELKFELLPRSQHSPDTVPSDYRIFGPIKEAFSGRRFAGDVAVKDVCVRAFDHN